MRTFDKEDKDDLKELENLKAEAWMIDALKLNPSYVFWGPFEDYMGDGTVVDQETGDYSGNKNKGWAQNSFYKTWKAFGPWKLDELNELVNFYFEIKRDNKRCKACEGEGLNPETLKVSKDFYDFENTGNRWCDNITQDELEALIKAKRVYQDKAGNLPTLELINKINSSFRDKALRSEAAKFGVSDHDAINRWILIETRAKRLGVYGKCKECTGEGNIYTAPKAKLSLIMWFIHPRKGCSKGVLVEKLAESDLKEAINYLKEAKKRNNDRFDLAGD